MKKRKPSLLVYPVTAALLLLFGGYLLNTWLRYHGAKGQPVSVQLIHIKYHHKSPDQAEVIYNRHLYRLLLKRTTADALKNGAGFLLHYDARKDLVFDPDLNIDRYITGTVIAVFLSAVCLYTFFSTRRRQYLEAHRVRRFYR